MSFLNLASVGGSCLAHKTLRSQSSAHACKTLVGKRVNIWALKSPQTRDAMMGASHRFMTAVRELLIRHIGRQVLLYSSSELDMQALRKRMSLHKGPLQCGWDVRIAACTHLVMDTLITLLLWTLQSMHGLQRGSSVTLWATMLEVELCR